MAEFLLPLLTQDLDGVRARLIAPLRYATDVVPGLVLEVPAGFVTDFSSVPRVPLAYWLVGGKGRRASVPHDWGYELGGVVAGTVDADGDAVPAPGSPRLTRAQWDAIFFEALRLTYPARDLGPYARWALARDAWLMWAGVRAGGWARWGA
jgi:hypothetical protein